MALNKEHIIQELHKLVDNAKVAECPTFFNDERLEDAFLMPETDSEGYSDIIPVISHSYSYGKDEEGVLILSKGSADITSRLYTKYLDSEALVWDSAEERLFLYMPDPEEPRVAFKGSRWQFAKRLKHKDGLLCLRDIYYEYLEHNKAV